MASEINENQSNLNEDQSSFPRYNPDGGYQTPAGPFRAFFSKFFSGKKKRGRPSLKQEKRLMGDAASSDDVMAQANGAIGVTKGMYKLPKVEYSRRKRYADYERMEEYPEIGSSLDIYADDSCQKDNESKVFRVVTDSDLVKDAVHSFMDSTNLNKYIWDIVRNTVKFGDCFVENIVDLNNPTAGIQRLKILNPNYIYRSEDKYGYLKEFIQEIPKEGAQNQDFTPSLDHKTKNVLKLDKNQLVHFRSYTSDSNFYPYGKSILSSAVRAWKSLRMMEDAMIIYRLQRAPERRVFYIETGNLPQTKVEAFMERIKQKFKKEKFLDPRSGNVDERYNPLSADEDFFVPVRNGQGTKVDVLPGAQNLGDIDDVKYFRDKLLSALKIPKDFIVEKDSSPERKANLSQLDVKFAKVIARVQREVEIGINTIVRRHLRLREFPESMVKELAVEFQPPSDMFLKRRLETDEQKIRIVSAVKGLALFPDEYIYKYYFQLSDMEIKDIKNELEKQQEEEAEAQPDMGMGMGGMPMEGEEPPVGENMAPEEGAPPPPAEEGQ